MTTSQLLKWAGSKRAEGWLGRRATQADFRYMSEMCQDIAKALDSHRDIDANAIMARLEEKMMVARKAAVFGGKGRK